MSPKLVYTPRRFKDATLDVIAMANQILEEYEKQGFDLTLRQLYYQFVSRGLIPNSDREYDKLGSIVNDARMAGKVDWDHIVDRTRNLRALSSWRNPAQIIRGSARGYQIDKWADQDYRIEVWIEKDALVGVIAGVCQEFDVPYFSCRGYTSQSEMWSAGQRLGGYLQDGKRVRVLHLGDHDPSGVDMSRDIEERLFRFMATDRVRDEIRQARSEGIEMSDVSMGVAGDQAVDYVRDRRLTSTGRGRCGRTRTQQGASCRAPGSSGR